MKRPDVVVIDGRAYRWRDLVKLRKAQLDAWRAEHARQPALFPLRDDRRPVFELSLGMLQRA
ncbi:hypothetical protein [Sinorhizobium fredii]|uniref:hypothetical protein n=1 Tax=Rhizobium fredii TaxID=380 RepID=UPI003514926F